MNKIGAAWPLELEARTVQEAIPECEGIIDRLRQQRRDRSLSSWRAKMAHSKSSAGPDGISPQSLADMPLKFWTLFADRLAHWSQRNTFPSAWQEARMVLLPKMSFVALLLKSLV